MPSSRLGQCALTDEEISKKVAERFDARYRKDWRTSDALKEECTNVWKSKNLHVVIMVRSSLARRGTTTSPLTGSPAVDLF